ncbi:MAG: hypothetical protein IKC44_01530 [Burkholderiaceae bacterium]|nr:hypothetical protein [Burkholderiaceae bacterium]
MARQSQNLNESIVKNLSRSFPVDSQGKLISRKRYFDPVVEGLFFMVVVSQSNLLRCTWGIRKLKSDESPGFEKKIGDYPQMNLAQARMEAVRLAAEDYAPLFKCRKPSMLVGLPRQEKTLAVVSEMWFAHAKRINHYKNPRYLLKEKQRFTKNVLKYIGDRPITKLDLEDIVRTFRHCWGREATCDRAMATLRHVLRCAVNRGYCTIEKMMLLNPALLKFELGKRCDVTQPRPALAVHEIPQFMQALREKVGVKYRLLEFQILCVLRGENARCLKWQQVFLKPSPEVSYLLFPNEELKIPGNGNLKIPLLGRALEIIQEMSAFRNVGFPKHQQFVFPSFRKPYQPMCNVMSSLVIRELDQEKFDEDGIGWIDLTATELSVARGADDRVRISAHGTARSSFRTWASRNPKYQTKAVELCLHHRVGGKVENAYDRYDYFDERATILSHWGRYCGGQLLAFGV